MRLPPQPLDPRAWRDFELQPSRDAVPESAPTPAAAPAGARYDPFHVAAPEPTSKSAKVRFAVPKPEFSPLTQRVRAQIFALAQEVYRLRPAHIVPNMWLEDPSVTPNARDLAKQLVPHVATFQAWRVHGPELAAVLDKLVAALQTFDQSRKRKATQQ